MHLSLNFQMTPLIGNLFNFTDILASYEPI